MPCFKVWEPYHCTMPQRMGVTAEQTSTPCFNVWELSRIDQYTMHQSMGINAMQRSLHHTSKWRVCALLTIIPYFNVWESDHWILPQSTGVSAVQTIISSFKIWELTPYRPLYQASKYGSQIITPQSMGINAVQTIVQCFKVWAKAQNRPLNHASNYGIYSSTDQYNMIQT